VAIKRSPFEKSVVYLRSVNDGDVDSVVSELMERCVWRDLVRPGSKVVIKPNLCAKEPDQIEMSDTDVRITAAVCRTLRARTDNIVIAESDHLRNSIWDTYQVTGYDRMAKQLGVRLVNLSEMPTQPVPCPPAGELLLPTILLEADTLITLPVLKTHSLTYYTGALKNQWGCVPQYNRILLHKWLDALLVSLHRVFRPALTIMDGIVAMEGRGPVNGRPRRLDLLIASRDAVALDATAMRLVGLDPNCCKHIAMAGRAALGRFFPADIRVDGDWALHTTTFEPAVLDWAQALMNYMSRYNWFVKLALENDSIFKPGRSVVQFLRRIRLVAGA